MTSGWLSSSSSLFFSEIVGENVTVGDGVVGAALGAGTGMDDGARVVGAGIGPDDGTGVVGAWVGTGTGIFVGAALGGVDGAGLGGVVGVCVGAGVGENVATSKLATVALLMSRRRPPTLMLMNE